MLRALPEAWRRTGSPISCCPKGWRRVRSLSPEEAELWARVASTIRPLSREHKSSPERGGEPAKAVEGARVRAASTVGPHHHSASLHGPPPRSGEELKAKTLDSSWDRRLRSGSVEPDRVVDLHGMNLDTAWRVIDRALEQAIARGDRVVLLITGHHRPGDQPVRRGAIRAAVHDWLAASRHSGRIAAVRGAHRSHGGGGSLYVVLRRQTAPRR
ncbi:MAG TPA: Smr/MutS family protein [Sphingomicrobium sp.]|nr:Smr/MutS family protein [Sphingomicrobium sp.]